MDRDLVREIEAIPTAASVREPAGEDRHAEGLREFAASTCRTAVEAHVHRLLKYVDLTARGC